jgi:hypothetical protein
VSSVQDQLGLHKEMLSLKKKKKKRRAGGVAQNIECLPSKCEALSSNPSAAGNK